MFTKERNAITEIYVKWHRNLIRVKYFFSPHLKPFDASLRFSGSSSAIIFLHVLAAILSSDYELVSAENGRMTVLEIIAERAWGALKGPPVRPMVIEIKIYPGHRMMFLDFYRYESTDRDKSFYQSVMMEFLTKKEVLGAIAFLDDLLEENSSSATNNLDKIGRAIHQKSDAPQKLIYILRMPQRLIGL